MEDLGRSGDQTMNQEHAVASPRQKTIALRLSEEQVQHLMGALTQAQSEAEGEKLERLKLLHKAVVDACHVSTVRIRCQTCGRWLLVDRTRRPARYCSDSCRQKAYRARVARGHKL
jgi:hypothetical protein